LLAAQGRLRFPQPNRMLFQATTRLEIRALTQGGEAMLGNSRKGACSRVLRRARPDIAKLDYYQGGLWSPSYFAASCGAASRSLVRQSIEPQATPD
jgi:hypothetical protein